MSSNEFRSRAARFFELCSKRCGLVAVTLTLCSYLSGCGLNDVTQADDSTTSVATGGSNPGTGAGTAGGDPLTTGGSDANASGGGDTVPSGGTDSNTTGGTDGNPSGGADSNPSGGTAGSGTSPPPPPPPTSSRVDVIIDAGWKFNKGNVTGAEQVAFSDAAWTSLDLPHTWNNKDGQDGPTTTPAYYRGVGWYRKHYAIPADTMANKRLYLQFDASAFITDVWVNGTKVGSHSGGYSAFRFDITTVAKVGADNVIALKVDNSQSVNTSYAVVPGASTANVAPRSGDFTFFGGCYRDVHVIAADNLSVSLMDYGSSGVYLKPINVTAASADLSVTVRLSNANTAAKTASVDVTLLDASGATVQTLSGTQAVPATGTADLVVTGKVANPHLWNGLADPYVYHANVVVKDGATVTDAVQQPVGFRYFAFDVNTGFSLNGKPYRLEGVCMHQDHKDKGPVYSPKDIDTDFAILKELGATAVRFAHYQHPQYTYDKTDQAGIVAWVENALIESINDTPEFAANAKQQTTEVIRQNYNHPSIFIWSISNEILLRASTPAPGAASANVIGLIQQINALVHSEDSTRVTGQAVANGDNPLNLVPDLAGWNEYNGWYYGYVKDFAPWADREHKNNPAHLIGLTEYGAGASIAQQDLPIVETGSSRTGGAQTEEYSAFFHEAHWPQIQARPFLVWSTVWNLFDFASDYRNEGLVPGINTKGLITYDRQTKKDPFYLYKAAWSNDPFVHINYRRFTTMPRKATEIRLYSNQPEVEVKLNGTSLGKKQAPDHVFVWTGVTWATGTNIVTASATSGLGGTDTVTWTK